MNIEPKTLESWIKFIRFHPDLADTYMNCFWESQLKSKNMLMDILQKYRPMLGNCYIFGGWYGITTQLLHDNKTLDYKSIYSIDIDPKCEWVFNDVIDLPGVFAVTADCADFKYPEKPDTVINTVTEHLTEGEYNYWWDSVPSGAFYVLQGNDFIDWHEHVRCAENLSHFRFINNLNDSILIGSDSWSFQGPDGHEYNRFMAWGIK